MSYTNNGSNPFDLNTAQTLKSFEIIPRGEIVLVRTFIKPGGYNDPSRHYTDGIVTHNTGGKMSTSSKAFQEFWHHAESYNMNRFYIFEFR